MSSEFGVKKGNFNNCCSIGLSNFEEYGTFATKFSQLNLLEEFFPFF